MSDVNKNYNKVSQEDTKNIQKNNKLTWKMVYEKCNHSRFSQVTNVLRTAKIKSNIGNLLKSYAKLILFSFIVILIILIITFGNNLNIMLCAILLLIALCAFAIIYGTYYIKLEENGVKFKINFVENSIPYNKLIGIYLTKKRKRFFFVPIYYYALEITEYVDKEKMNIYSFPTIMLNKKDLINFFNSFEVNIIKDEEEEERKQNEERKNFHKAIGIVIGIIFIILLIIALILYVFNQ